MKYRFGLLLAALLFCFSLSVMAQQKFENWSNKPPQERAELLTKWMNENLELNSEQNNKVYDINLKYAEKAEGLKTSSQSKMSKFKTLKGYGEAKDEEFKEVLSAEQLETYLDKKEELRKMIKESR